MSGYIIIIIINLMKHMGGNAELPNLKAILSEKIQSFRSKKLWQPCGGLQISGILYQIGSIRRYIDVFQWQYFRGFDYDNELLFNVNLLVSPFHTC